jgi:hypothetical protein
MGQTLLYTRDPQNPDEHVWRFENGEMALWRGHTAWHFAAPSGVRYLGPVDFTDGDAITLFHAKRRILEAQADAQRQ